MNTRVEYYCISHIGCERPENQDNFVCVNEFNSDAKSQPVARCSGSRGSSEPFFLGVFDGLGGGEYGEVASLIAAKTAAETSITSNLPQTLGDMFYLSNKRICDFRYEKAIGTVGATAAILAFSPELILSANIGDSRIFRLSGEDFIQISKNHVIQVGDMPKPTLSQHLGIPENERILRPFFMESDWVIGDKYLICSDGLTDLVSNEEFAFVLRNSGVKDCAEYLVANALERGGVDNITLIVAEIKGEVEGYEDGKIRAL